MRGHTHFSTMRLLKNDGTQAVYTRRASERSDGLGVLDSAAIEKVKTEAWPEATNPDELHDALMLIGLMTLGEIHGCANGESTASPLAPPVERKRDACATFECNDAVMGQLFKELVASNRAAQLQLGDHVFLFAAERLPMLR